MRPSPVADVAARVVAWHNRHPLARRITAAQVQGVGVVAMPFVLPGSPAAASARAVDEPALFAAPQDDAGNGSGDGDAAPVASPPSLRERALAAAVDGSLSATAMIPMPALPKVVEPPPSLRHRLQRWLAGLRPAARRGFSEDFIAPLSPRRIARFALRHGSAHAPQGDAGPLRAVLEDDGLCALGSVQTWHLRTAAIEVGSRRVRVLLGDGPDAAVLGPRLWSPARLASSAAAWALAMTGLIAAQLMSRHGGEAEGVREVASAVPAASAAAQAMPSASAASGVGGITDESAVVVTRAEPAVVLPPPASASAIPAPHSAVAVVAAASAATPPAGTALAAVPRPPAASPAGVASAPSQAAALPPVAADASAPVTKPAAPAWPVNIRPVIDVETARAAKRDSSAMRAQGGAPVPEPALADAMPPKATTAQRARSPDDAVHATGVTYALAARSTRSRAASELLLGMMKTAAAGSADKTARTEVLPAQQGWRAIWWPFHTRQEAEKAHALLVSVGLEAELLEF